MNEIMSKHPLIREKRLNSSSAFYDDAAKYASELEKDDVKQRIRTFSEDTYNDVLYAIEALHSIQDGVVIVHGPRGCGNSNVLDSTPYRKARWITTNLNQRDSIMGSDAKLRKTVVQAVKQHKPAVIFILATPVVAINNDDIQSVVEELSVELEVPIIPIDTNGFKSKIGVSGYDTVFHGIIKYLKNHVKVQNKEEFVNVISITENQDDLLEVAKLLKETGLESNFLPRLSHWHHFERAVLAKATLVINSEDGDFFAKALEEQFDIPYLQTALPVGKKNIRQWLQVLLETRKEGDELGLNVDNAQYLNKVEQQFPDHLDLISLAGIKVYIHLKPSYAFEIARLLEEYGAEVVGISVTHIDELHQKNVALLAEKKQNLHVAGGQHFEIVNILKRVKPDIYVGCDGQYTTIAQLGIVPIALEKIGVLGYAGEIRLIEVIRNARRNTNFVKQLNRISDDYGYKDAWFEKKPNWYIKQEVK